MNWTKIGNKYYYYFNRDNQYYHIELFDYGYYKIFNGFKELGSGTINAELNDIFSMLEQRYNPIETKKEEPHKVEKSKETVKTVEEIKKEPEIIEVVEDAIPCVLEGDTVDSKESEIKETESIENSDTISINKKENEDGTLTVELSSVEGAVIKYTTNGREVVVSSKIYREPFVVNKGTTLNATAFVNKEPVGTLVNVTLD